MSNIGNISADRWGVYTVFNEVFVHTCHGHGYVHVTHIKLAEFFTALVKHNPVIVAWLKR